MVSAACAAVPLMLLAPLMLLVALCRFTLIDRDSGGSIEICEFQEFTSSLGASVDQVHSATDTAALTCCCCSQY